MKLCKLIIAGVAVGVAVKAYKKCCPCKKQKEKIEHKEATTPAEEKA